MTDEALKLAEEVLSHNEQPTHTQKYYQWVGRLAGFAPALASAYKELHTRAERTEARVAELGGHVKGLQATLVACERACWKEGQTAEGLSRDIRRAVSKFMKDGTSRTDEIWDNPETARIAVLREALDNIADHAPWGGPDIREYVKWMQDIASRALSDPDTRADALLACVGALETIAEKLNTGRPTHDGFPKPCSARDAETMFALARDSLAAYKGASDG